MDRSRLKSKKSRLRQSRTLERESTKGKSQVTKKNVKHHGGKGLPREMMLLATTEGFWSSPQEFRTSRTASINVTAREPSGSLKVKKSQSVLSKDCQKTSPSGADKKTPKSVKEPVKETNSLQKSSKSTSQLKRLETTDGFWSPGISETKIMSLSDSGKIVEKEKEPPVARSYTPSIMSELKRLQTTEGFWSPSFQNPSPRQSSRETSPSSTNSSMDRVARRSSLKQSEKKRDEDPKIPESERLSKNSISLKRTRSALCVTEKVKSTPTFAATHKASDRETSDGKGEPPSKRAKTGGVKTKEEQQTPTSTLKASDKETPVSSSEPLFKRAKISVIKKKEEPAALRRAKVSMGSPNGHDGPSSDKKLVSKSKSDSPSSPARTGTNCQKTPSPKVSDFVQSIELKRLNTTDGFWSPLPKISYVLGARDRRPARTSVQPQSQLLEHRKKKLKSLKLTARNISYSGPGVSGRQPCCGRKTDFQTKPVLANQGDTLPPSSDKQRHPKASMFGDGKAKFRHSRRAIKAVQMECDEASSSSVTVVECNTDKKDAHSPISNKQRRPKTFMFGLKKFKRRKRTKRKREQSECDGALEKETPPPNPNKQRGPKTYMFGARKKFRRRRGAMKVEHTEHDTVTSSLVTAVECNSDKNNAHTPNQNKQRRTKTFMFGARRKFRPKRGAMKVVQTENDKAASSSVTVLEQEPDKDGRRSSKGNHHSSVVPRVTKSWQKGRRKLIHEGEKSNIQKSSDRHASKEDLLNQSVEVLMNCEENADSCPPETHKSSQNVRSLRSDHIVVDKSEIGGGGSELRKTRRSLHLIRRGSAIPPRRGVTRHQEAVILVRRGAGRRKGAEPHVRGRRNSRAFRNSGSSKLEKALPRTSNSEMAPETDCKGSARTIESTKLVREGLRGQLGQCVKKSPAHSSSEDNHSNIFDIMEEATAEIRDTQNRRVFNDTSGFGSSFLPDMNKCLPGIKPNLSDATKMKYEHIEKGFNPDKKLHFTAPRVSLSTKRVDTNTDVKEKVSSKEENEDGGLPCAGMDATSQYFENETNMEIDSCGDGENISNKDAEEKTGNGRVQKIPSVELKASEIQIGTINDAKDALDKDEKDSVEKDFRGRLQETLSEENADVSKTLTKDKFGDVEESNFQGGAISVDFGLKSADDGHQTQGLINETNEDGQKDTSDNHSCSSLKTEKESVGAKEKTSVLCERSTVDDGVVIKGTETDHQLSDKNAVDDATGVAKDSALVHSQSELGYLELVEEQIQQTKDASSSQQAEATLPGNQVLESKPERDEQLEVLSDQVVENQADTIRQTDKEKQSEEVKVSCEQTDKEEQSGEGKVTFEQTDEEQGGEAEVTCKLTDKEEQSGEVKVTCQQTDKEDVNVICKKTDEGQSEQAIVTFMQTDKEEQSEEVKVICTETDKEEQNEDVKVTTGTTNEEKESGEVKVTCKQTGKDEQSGEVKVTCKQTGEEEQNGEVKGTHKQMDEEEQREEVKVIFKKTDKEEQSGEVKVTSPDSLESMLSPTASSSDQSLHKSATTDTKVGEAQKLTADQSNVEESIKEIEKEIVDERMSSDNTATVEEYSNKPQAMEDTNDPSAKKVGIGKGAVRKNYLIRSRQNSLHENSSSPLDSNNEMAFGEKVNMRRSPSSAHNPLRKVRKRRCNRWRRGVVKKAKRISTQNKLQQSNSPSRGGVGQMKSLFGNKKDVSLHNGHSDKVRKLPLMPKPDTVAELAEQASKILDVSPDSDKPKKLLKVLKRLKTDANLANACIDTKTLQTRARKGLLPVTRRGPGSRQKLEASESNFILPGSTKELKVDSALPLTDAPTDLQSFRDEIPKLEKTCLPKLSPLSLVTARPEDGLPVAANPPVLTPQQPIDFFMPFNADAKTPTGEDDVVNESVDDTDFHLYLSGASDDEDTADLGSQTTMNVFSGTSKTNQGKSLQASVLSEETKANSVSSSLALTTESNCPTPTTITSPKSKMRGKRGRPPGIRVSQRDVLIPRPKSEPKSVPRSHLPWPMRTFEFRKKTTRSPLQMLEMRRKQEEAIYDLEMERIQARKIIRREKRIARAPVEDLAEQEMAAYFNLRPCSVVLSDFVKKLNLDETFSDLYHENIPSSSFSPDYVDDSEDEDWCADLEDVEDEFEEECIEEKKSLKRPYIPRLKLKRLPKKGKPTVIASKSKNLVSKLKSPEQEPLKLVIKTESFSDQEDLPRKLSSQPQGSTVFENNYIEFLRQRSMKSKPPVSDSSSLQEARHFSSNSSSVKDSSNVNWINQDQMSKNDNVRKLVLLPRKPLAPKSLADIPVTSKSLERGDLAVSSSNNGCHEAAPQNVNDSEAPSIQAAVPEGIELGAEEEEDMLIVDLASPESKQEDTTLVDRAAVLNPKDQTRSMAQCADENSEMKASSATSSTSLSAVFTLSCNSFDHGNEEELGNKNEQLSSVEHKSDLDTAGTTRIDLNIAGFEIPALATDCGSDFVNKATDGKGANAAGDSQTPELKDTEEVNGSGLTLELSKDSNSESPQKDGAIQSTVEDLQQTNERLIVDNEVGPTEESAVESENNAVTQGTCSSFETNKDFPSSQENTEIETHSNNNNNNVKSVEASMAVDSNSPVHSTSEEPNKESRKLKTIPSSFKQMSGSYKCNRCSFTAVSKLSIESHIYSHIPGVHFQCIKCQSEFSSMNAINTHFKNSHPNTEIEFYISRNLEESNFYTISKEQEEVVRSPIPTGAGGQSPPLIISLVVSGGARSVRSSSAAQRFVCTHCGFSTNVKEDVQQHVSDLHATKSLYSCKLCNDSVGLSESEIKEHSASVHPSRQRPYVKLPDFYDADQLAMRETCGNSEERGGNVLRVSTLFPGDESPREQTSVGHQMKAKDYLYLQEGWKGKTSAEADSTTATDYSDENLVDTTSNNEASEDISKDESCSSEAKSSSADDDKMLCHKEPSALQVEDDDNDVSHLKIAEVVSLSDNSHGPEDAASTNVTVPSPQTTSNVETSENSNVNVSDSSESLASLSSQGTMSSSSKSPISDLPVANSLTDISVAVTSHSSITDSKTTPSPPLMESEEQDHGHAPDASNDAQVPVTSETKSCTEVPVTSECTTPPLVSTIAASSLPLSTSTTSLSSSEAVTQVTASDKPVASPLLADVDMRPSPSGTASDVSSQAQTSSAGVLHTEGDQAPESHVKNLSTTSTDVSEKNVSATISQTSSSSSVAGGLPLSYQCKSCKVHTPYLLMMVRHLKSRHPKILCFSCPYCKSGQSFNTQKQLRLHVRSMHPDKVDKNEMSLSDEAKKFVEAMVLPKSPQCTRVGNRLILEEDIHTCTVCSLRMTSLSSVYDHLNEKHSDLFEFVCPSCQSFKNKSLQVVSDHCISVHKSELDKDKVHVSVPKYLFTILSCISKQAKYIEKSLTPSSSSAAAPSKDSSNSSSSEETSLSGKEERKMSNPQPVKPQAMPSKGSHSNQTGDIGPVMESPIPPPAHCIPLTTSVPTGVSMDMLMKPTSFVAIPIMAPSPITSTPTTRAVVAISSSLFDTSSLSLPKSSSATPSPAPILPLGVSPRMVAQQRASKPFPLPVLNVPTIRPRSAAVVQPPQQPLRPPSGESSSAFASTTPGGGNSALASADQLPEDEPNPDAFKIFNLRPTGLTPPAMAAPVSVAQASPSVFPPVSSTASLPSGFIPGPMAGFPAAMVIPPALLHNAFPFAAASIANPVPVVGDGSKGQGKFPVQNIRPMPQMLAGRLPQPHLQNIPQAKLLLYQQQQKQRMQLASQNAAPGAAVRPHSVGHSQRFPQNPVHPRLPTGMVREHPQRASPSFPTTMGPVLSAAMSSPQFISPQPGPSSITSPSNPSKKGRKSSTLYRCPYCVNGPPLKALEVASHIRHAHPGCQVTFQKAT